ncbi:PTS sugar transporter subunit IIA [Lentilactobacillus curieae]|uniref:PTS sugar transporter subunit IIA n=1 Tax=Lentilactobacillus curieae TaxID=1138822 RepID=A0A1S6QIJ5_9LACO|nr:glycoside-pentoside-hexuronide (GPH):cation symporter [Lentilactobacillus curieae]AQW21428.1 PTS sugar transporter subunit IIA [Lentilactobacillus curieae]
MDARPSTAKKLTSRLSYAFGAFGHDMFYNTLSVYFIMFVTAHLFDKSAGGENAKMIAYITAIIFVLRFVELAIDPFIGNTIDNTNSRWGHFKPWILAGGTVGSIVLTILFSNMGGLNNSSPIMYLIIFAILYITMDIFYSFKDVGFWSMIPAISFDTKEREKTATFARVGSTIGANIVGIFVMPLVLAFSVNSNHGQGDLRGWFVFGLTIAVISWISAVAVGVGTKETDTDLRKNAEKTSFKDVFKVLGRNDQLMWLSLTYGLYTAGIQITNSLELYYFTYILGKPLQFSSLATLNSIIGIFAVLAFPPMAQKFSRRNVFFISIAIMIASIILFAFSGQSLTLVLISAVLFYIPQPLIFLVVLMIISDSVEYGQLKFGHRDESLTLSVRPLLDKLGGAVSNGVAGLTAVLAGMTAGVTANDVTPHGALIFKLMMFGIPALLILIGTFVFFKKVTLDEKQHEKIVDELEKTWHKHLDGSEEGEKVSSLTVIKAPVSGQIMPLDQVESTKFADGTMGKGFAIKPSDETVIAPFDGTVEATFPTRHAIGLKSDSGVLTLIHIGNETVTLKGNGFTQFVEQGDRIVRGQKLIEFSDQLIKQANIDDTVMVAISNSAHYTSNELTVTSGSVNSGDDVFEVSNPLNNENGKGDLDK